VTDPDATPPMPSATAGISAELSAVHRELREMRSDLRSYRDESASIRQEVATLRTEVALAQRDVDTSHHRIDAMAAARIQAGAPWRSVLPSVVASIIVGLLAMAGMWAMSAQPVENHTTEGAQP